MLASALVVVAALALLWMVGSAVLRALAWFFVAAMAISLVAGIPVPTGVVVGTVVCWVGGHVFCRLRHRCSRSHLFDNALSRRQLDS